MAETEVPYDASRVMFNGAAIALVTNLINGVKDDIKDEVKAVEDRQSRRLDEAIRVLSGDVEALEAWREAQDDAALVRKGQLSIFRTLGAFIIRYDRALLGIGFTLLATAIAAALGVRIGMGG